MHSFEHIHQYGQEDILYDYYNTPYLDLCAERILGEVMKVSLFS